MTDPKSITGDIKRIAADAQAAGAEFTSAVAGDVQRFAKDVGKSGGKAGDALQDDIADLRKEVSRILVTVRKLAVRVSGDVSAAAEDKFDELATDTKKAGARARTSLASVADETEAVIAAHPLASILIALGAGFLISRMMRR